MYLKATFRFSPKQTNVDRPLSGPTAHSANNSFCWKAAPFMFTPAGSFVPVIFEQEAYTFTFQISNRKQPKTHTNSSIHRSPEMASEKFCLRWNDFESNISVAFRELREEEDFFDVTLACDDNQVQCHKVILSACSPFFRAILRKNPHQHPLLYLNGVKYQELLSVLNFMYQGEVNVAEEELNSFLAVAEELKVKGLTQSNQGGAKNNPAPREPPKKPRPAANHLKPAPTPSYSSQQYNDDIQEVVPVKSEPRESALPQLPAAIYKQQQQQQQHSGTVALDDYAEYGEGAYDDGQYGEVLDNYAEIDAKMAKDQLTGLWSCTDCQFTSKPKTNLRNHIEVHHVASQGYFCPVCKKVCKTRNALSNHKSRNKH